MQPFFHVLLSPCFVVSFGVLFFIIVAPYGAHIDLYWNVHLISMTILIDCDMMVMLFDLCVYT